MRSGRHIRLVELRWHGHLNDSFAVDCSKFIKLFLFFDISNVSFDRYTYNLKNSKPIQARLIEISLLVKFGMNS